MTEFWNPTGEPRALLALQRLLEGTNLAGATLASTKPKQDGVYDERNLVVATHHTVVDREQLRNDLVAEPTYRRLTAQPPDDDAVPVGIERPILHVTVDAGVAVLHVINVHPKSKIPTDIPGQKIDGFTWKTADGSFLSSMKPMSQALEVRLRLVDRILDANPDARIVVAGDFNATPDEVPVLAIGGAASTPRTTRSGSPCWPRTSTTSCRCGHHRDLRRLRLRAQHGHFDESRCLLRGRLACR
jgi:hypothetical protein